MKNHICSEYDTAWNFYTEQLQCVVCGKEFGKWPWRDYLMQKTNSTTGIIFSKLDRDTTEVAKIRGSSRQHVYAEYAALFFANDETRKTR